uniref:Actin-like n=1 Tax=Saccoglossus kowalevskii TaxID=10224 RepID=A0ABM0H0Y2_SACKO|nr:PREDICTED: actin-like [Saccoglossus kowalevskii]
MPIRPTPYENTSSLSIYLSGGVTLTPGFAERLQAELVKLFPKTLVIQVCYVAEDYDAEMRKCSEDVGLCTASVDLEPYDLPDKNKSIYLSGGVTLTPGFAERLQAELVKLFPKTLVIQVHAAAERYHSAYLGACILASLNAFTNMCISREEYTKRGPACVSKWEIR